MKPKHHNALVNFLAVLFEMVTNTVQNENTMKGFVGPSMIDVNSRGTPILTECCKLITGIHQEVCIERATHILLSYLTRLV